jgi:hypothetical protein
MNTLIYKRTHTGDPNEAGIFGCRDCMGGIRNRNIGAVIGIGGMRPDHGHEEIALKINWIGINPIISKPHKPSFRGPSLTFEPAFFRLWDSKGPDLKIHAPKLFKYLFKESKSSFRRFVMSQSLSAEMQKEVATILRLASNQKSRQPRVYGKKHSPKCKRQNKCFIA